MASGLASSRWPQTWPAPGGPRPSQHLVAPGQVSTRWPQAWPAPGGQGLAGTWWPWAGSLAGLGRLQPALQSLTVFPQLEIYGAVITPSESCVGPYWICCSFPGGWRRLGRRGSHRHVCPIIFIPRYPYHYFFHGVFSCSRL